jgi:rod shape-determining protein MreB
MAIVETVRTCLEQTPPELAADIVDTGIVITGGGGLLRGLDRLLGTEIQLPVTVAKDPMPCVALGVGRVLDELELLKKVAMPARRRWRWSGWRQRRNQDPVIGNRNPVAGQCLCG